MGEEQGWGRVTLMEGLDVGAHDVCSVQTRKQQCAVLRWAGKNKNVYREACRGIVAGSCRPGLIFLDFTQANGLLGEEEQIR